MAKKCPLCGNKLSGLIKFKTADGEICGICSNLCASYQTENIREIQAYWDNNNDRTSRFSKSVVLKSLFSDWLVIDNTHRLFYIGKKESNPTRIVYSFDEVISYEFKEVGGRVVTKSKGGLGRAVVGGALFGGAGAVVAASTSKKETKTEGAVNMLKIDFSTIAGKTTRFITPPGGATAFLDKCIDNQPEQGDTLSSVVPPESGRSDSFVSEIEEIKRFQELFDQGILTQDEFAAKKKQIMGL